ncbi:MAG TPA: hypothetical protein VJZ26_04400 [Blastocatellia bacterium]|nr:hypothetical protein [Blastocatellia bacterium]
MPAEENAVNPDGTITKDMPPGPLDADKLMPKLLPLWQKYGIGAADPESDE